MKHLRLTKIKSNTQLVVDYHAVITNKMTSSPVYETGLLIRHHIADEKYFVFDSGKLVYSGFAQNRVSIRRSILPWINKYYNLKGEIVWKNE